MWNLWDWWDQEADAELSFKGIRGQFLGQDSGGAQGAPAATSHHDARGAASAQTMEGMARGHMDTGCSEEGRAGF